MLSVHPRLVILYLVIAIVVVPLTQPSNITVLLAQNESNVLDNSNVSLSSSMSQTTESGATAQNNLSSSTVDSANPSLPILTQVSDKGTYKVQLRWSSPLDIQSPAILSRSGFDMEVLFLNASSQGPTPQNSRINNNLTTEFERSITNKVPNLSTVEPLATIDSFDITVYDNKGKELWSKTDVTPSAGMAPIRVTLDPSYTGGISISIYNIKSPLTSSSDEKSNESVKFTANVRGEK